MTQDAQNALRRIIEKFTENVRFCLICNYLSKIIPALQSRCTRFRFGPLNAAQILPRLELVCESEKVRVTEDGKQALLALSQGDMRKVLNILQSCYMAFEEVNEDNVYTCVGHPLKSDVSNILNWMLNESFSKAYERIQTLKTQKGLSLQDILTEVHLLVHRLDLPERVKIHLLVKMADLEHRLLSGASEKIQLGALLAAFQVTREMVKEEAQK
jgi:replication factor C subunit 3/5